MLEVGVEATAKLNKDGDQNGCSTQNSTHSDLPPELEGKALDLDNLAYEVIAAWDSLPLALKEAIVSIVRSHKVKHVDSTYVELNQCDSEGGAS